jgi:peptidoglycan hydrolase CwlO-like protein
MKSRLTRTGLAIGLSVITMTATITAGTAYANTGDSLQQKVNNIDKKQKENKQELNKAKSDLAQNKSEQEDINAQIATIKKEIDDATAKISKKQDQISTTRAQVEALKKSIEQLQQTIKERDALLKERVRSMYINGGSIDYLQVLLGSKDFGDFVTRVLALNTIAEQDKSILNEQKADKAKLVDKQTEVTQTLANLNKDLDELKSMENALADKKAKQQSLLAQLKVKEADLEDEVMSQQEVAQNLAAQKAAAQKAYALWKEEEKRRASQPQQNSYHNGRAIMQWPTSGPVTSGFGYRNFRGSEFHPGIDIAPPAGTPVVAAADGVVFRSYRSSSYGNCVMITHYIDGHEYTTVYAHMQDRLVGDGAVVHAGQPIGHVGSTGDSTGPHLHFEVYNGEWQGPPHHGAINPLTVLP